MKLPATRRAAGPPTTTVAAIWGKVLPLPAAPDAGDDFEARVHRAWEHLKAGYFAAAEQDRLRETLAGVIAKEQCRRRAAAAAAAPLVEVGDRP